MDYLMTGLQSARARRQAAARPRQRPRPGLQVGKVGPQGAEQPRKAGLAAVCRRPGVAACACGARPVGIAGRRAQRTLAAAPTATLAMVENALGGVNEEEAGASAIMAHVKMKLAKSEVIKVLPDRRRAAVQVDHRNGLFWENVMTELVHMID